MSIPIENKLDFDFELNQQILNKIADIENFRGSWRFLEGADRQFLNELRHVATIQSIGSSTRIEGVKLTDLGIETLIDNLRIDELQTRDSQEVVGYWETLNIIIENADSLTLTENYIFQLHDCLLKHSSKDISQRGRYKGLSNQVIARYPDGSERTIFKTTEPHLVAKEMKDLVSWTNSALMDGRINPVLVIATFVYEFLSIHPFHDGNGRLSRLLTTLLLIKSGYNYVQYISFEHIVEMRKKEYYQVLMAGQKHRYTEKEKIHQWLIFFLDCMVSLADGLDGKVSNVETKGIYLSVRQKNILRLFSSDLKLKFSDIFSQMPSFGASTIKKDLKFLSDNSLLEKIGRGKGTVYGLARDRM